MSRYAVIRNDNKRAQSVILWDGQTPYFPGPGLAMVRVADDDPVSEGDLYDTSTGKFTYGREPESVIEGVTNSAIARTGKDALVNNQAFLDKFNNNSLTPEDIISHMVSLTIDQMKLIRFFLALKQFGGDGITPT